MDTYDYLGPRNMSRTSKHVSDLGITSGVICLTLKTLHFTVEQCFLNYEQLPRGPNCISEQRSSCPKRLGVTLTVFGPSELVLIVLKQVQNVDCCLRMKERIIVCGTKTDISSWYKPEESSSERTEQKHYPPKNIVPGTVFPSDEREQCVKQQSA